MQAEQKYLIHLYDCGVRGLAPQPPEEPVSWEHILQLAKQQAVTGVICCALRRAEFCPAAIRLQCRKNAVSIAMLNKERTEAVMQTLKLLKAEGLHPAVIKGYDVARFYAIPESRTSADTDLLLPPEEEQKAYAVLAAQMQHGTGIRACFPCCPLPWQRHAAVTSFGIKQFHCFVFDTLTDCKEVRKTSNSHS